MATASVNSTRQEKDSIGFKEVPANAYYGVQTARAVENYPISGMRAHPTLIRAIGLVKQAAAEANKALQLVDEPRANAIIKAAQEVAEGKWDKEFVVDVFQAGAGVSFHMNSNEVIANRATELMGGKLGEYTAHPNDHVNYGQSTNDVFPTAMRLGALLELEKLYPVLESLAVSLEKKAKEFHDIMKSGRTHMQDAVPIRLGQEFAAYAISVRKAIENIRQASNELRELGLGGSAVGTGINTHPDYREKAIANHLEANHGCQFGHDGIDLPRHDGGTGLQSRQIDFGKAGVRTGREQAQIVRDADNFQRQVAQGAGNCSHR